VLLFGIYPVVWEGRGVEACLWYDCFDPERLDKSFSLSLVLRLSESRDMSRVFSSISAKFDDRASRAHNVRRLDIALSLMEYAFERTAKMPITCVSLLRRWKMLMSAYNEGVHLLNKHKPLLENWSSQTGYHRRFNTNRW